MHVVTGSDENYVIGVLVLLASLARHNPDARATILALGWSDISRARLDTVAEKSGISVKRIDVDQTALPPIKLGRTHLTIAALMRLLIPDLLPDDSRVLYMDCDMVVTGDLRAAWEVVLQGAPIAAVPCPSPAPEQLERLGLSQSEYVNSGLLLMNLSYWRETQLGSRCIEALSQDHARYSGDEAVINAFCRGRIVYLPAEFNVYASRATPQPVLERPDELRVLHFALKPKAWNAPTPFCEIWWAAARPIAEVLPPARNRLRERLRAWNYARRCWIGWVVGKPHYRHVLHNSRQISRAVDLLLSKEARCAEE